MLAFSRFTSVLFFLLSLSFLVAALPTSGNALASRDPTCSDKVVSALVDLQAHVEVDVKILASCKTVTEVTAQVDVMVGHIKACADLLIAIGAKIDMDASLKDEVAAKVAAIIKLIVSACLEVSAKLGAFVVIGLFAKIDICLKLLLVNLGICIDGIVFLVAKIVASVCADALVRLNFKLCLSVLALLKL